MKKEWKVFLSAECPNCGDGIKVYTACLEENDSDFEQWFTDGDTAVCTAECGFESVISADENGVWVQDGNLDELEAE